MHNTGKINSIENIIVIIVFFSLRGDSVWMKSYLCIFYNDIFAQWGGQMAGHGYFYTNQSFKE